MTRTHFFLSLCCATLLAGGPEAPGKLLEKPTYFTGPAAVQTFAEGDFFYVPAKTTLKDMPVRMLELVPQLYKALMAVGLPGLGPVQVVYHNMDSDPTKVLDIEVGVMVSKGTQASAGCLVRHMAPFTCVTTVFTGSPSKIGKVYETLYPTLLAAGKTPTAESRQMVLFWEGDTSTNNMLLVQIGVR